MGKPFQTELIATSSVYEWALNVDIAELITSIGKIRDLPLLCVGSGGSFSAAHFASKLHEHHFGSISKPITPLEFVRNNTLPSSAVLLLSAGGSNPDILGAYESAVVREAKQILILTFKKVSRLVARANLIRNTRIDFFDIPTRRDGFLATNSLLAFCVILQRAYCNVSSLNPDLPSTLSELLGVGSDIADKESETRRSIRALWERQNLVVLHGTDTTSAAIDIESKFTESAIGVTQIADYRNFAHGRHHWLAKHGDATSVVALVTPNDSVLAKRTLRLIPAGIPRTTLETPLSGFTACISLLVSSFYLSLSAGEARGIDPGRPGVPSFGSKIYRLKAFKEEKLGEFTKGTFESVVIERKARLSPASGIPNSKSVWRDSLAKFIGRIAEPEYKAVVFDYDGTLCDEKDRFTGMSSIVSNQIVQLLSKSNIVLGIATGRGKSVRIDLQSKLPSRFWSRVVIGYYNSSQIGGLDESMCPNGSERVTEELKLIADLLLSDPLLESSAAITLRERQITVEPNRGYSVEKLWGYLQNLVYSVPNQDCLLVSSTHSFDVIPRSVSKRTVVDYIKLEIGNAPPILCIGDKGNYPGNDYSLLSTPYSLSVDEVSTDLETCWNIAPPGIRGIQAVLWYLDRFEASKDGFRFLVRDLL
ncbi:MAG: hypothetical protein AB7F88_09330 [Pyrinomonadaceae bacterium]